MEGNYRAGHVASTRCVKTFMYLQGYNLWNLTE